MLIIAKKELHQFFSSLSGYITLLLFFVINAIYLFVLKDSNIFDFGYATLDAFFEFAPWIFLLIIPALAMRTFSEEFKSGTFETLKTRPLTQWQITLGKYLAIEAVILIALIPTILYVITIYSLSASGNLDSGGIIGSYIGLFFLASVFAAISIWCSSLTSNPVVAFLLSAFTCLILYFGFSSISRLPVFSGNADYYIEMLGINFHYQSISRGVIDTRDIIYFFSVIFLFLFATQKNTNKFHRA